jgi:putative transposase
MIESEYLNDIVEQVVRHSDHRFIKKITRPMLGFKSFASAEATLAGIELHHIIRKGQLKLEDSTPFGFEEIQLGVTSLPLS